MKILTKNIKIVICLNNYIFGLPQNFVILSQLFLKDLHLSTGYFSFSMILYIHILILDHKTAKLGNR